MMIKQHQRGLTLVELMVALALSLFVVLAALGVLVATKQGFVTTDASSKLQDNARFVHELVRRIAMQAGFESYAAQASSKLDTDLYGAGKVESDIAGFNNAFFVAGIDPNTVTNNSRSDVCGSSKDTGCANGSDVLILRYQGANTVLAAGDATLVQADSTMINCAGLAEQEKISTGTNRPTSVFHVDQPKADLEPTLMCTYRDSAGKWQTVALLSGVESFQVLYGVDGVTAGQAPTATEDTVADTYLRADQIVVLGNAQATKDNWSRVRSLRIGLIIRGPVGSADRLDQTWYPLGETFASSGDTGSTFMAGADGRLRQSYTYTIHLRNR